MNRVLGCIIGTVMVAGGLYILPTAVLSTVVGLLVVSIGLGVIGESL